MILPQLRLLLLVYRYSSPSPVAKPDAIRYVVAYRRRRNRAVGYEVAACFWEEEQNRDEGGHGEDQ